ncbi:MAG: 6-phosphofructokinase [Lachnospiraceae bacterium]
MTIKNCMVAQSGGPTAAINASLAGVISQAKKSGYHTVYGSVNGILGILHQHYLDLGDFTEDDIHRLISTPAMYLGSCRYKLPDAEIDDSPYQTIFQLFEQLNIHAFFYIGGNDSMDTVLKLSAYAKKTDSPVRVIGIPKTIDNDLLATDHTPGFGSAAKYIASSVLEIAHDTFIYPVKSVTIVEIMGRDAGWLTASSALARTAYSGAPHLIYLPEVAFDKDAFLEDVRYQLTQVNNVIIAVSEGIRDKDGNYISASSKYLDQFGHSQLSGAGKSLEYLVQEQIGVKVRSIEVNVLQRCASHLASKTDLDESFMLGKTAVCLSTEGVTGSMVTLTRTSNEPYTVTYGHSPIDSIANEAKSVPLDWIAPAGNDITDAFLDYLRPLIQGESSVCYENGMPSYMDISHLARNNQTK